VADGTRVALSASLNSIFVTLVPLAALGLALSLALPERPLRQRASSRAEPETAGSRLVQRQLGHRDARTTERQ
jgi:hypothetical protein